jgi:hypothetical protein
LTPNNVFGRRVCFGIRTHRAGDGSRTEMVSS